MKVSYLLPLAGLSAAFVVPNQDIFTSLEIETKKDSNLHHAWEATEESLKSAFKCATNAWDEAVHSVGDAAQKAEAQASELWEDAATSSWLQPDDSQPDLFDHPPPPHHKRPHRKPHHGPHKPHHHKPNQTVYELIAGSKYTTKLAKLINEDTDLVALLNRTVSNFTIFAPVDSAFDKIPEHDHEPSKEYIKALLLYHISPEFYPAGRVLSTKTIPTALEGEFLGSGNPQRISNQLSLRGLTLNFYARVIAIDIFGTNGVIHGIDSLLFPPPKGAEILSFLPGEFSTLELGLLKTGLLPMINDTSTHVGGTLFAPSNFAFKLLGPRINAFLFSSYGEKYLRALLKYHVVANYTLYSDAFYQPAPAGDGDDDSETTNVPKGVFHVDLPTLLPNHALSVDVAQFGRLVSIRINGFNRVAVSDGIAADGVIHVVPNVLIPPKTPGGKGERADGMDVQELVERLRPFVEEDGDDEVEMGREDWGLDL